MFLTWVHCICISYPLSLLQILCFPNTLSNSWVSPVFAWVLGWLLRIGVIPLKRGGKTWLPSPFVSIVCSSSPSGGVLWKIFPIHRDIAFSYEWMSTNGTFKSSLWFQLLKNSSLWNNSRILDNQSWVSFKRNVDTWSIIWLTWKVCSIHNIYFSNDHSHVSKGAETQQARR